jgi:Signal transduction histidine kinase
MLKYRFASLNEFICLRDHIKDFLATLCSQDAELLFVAINEAVNNAIFHGCSDNNVPNIELIISRSQEEVSIVVRHDGVGCSHESSENKEYTDDLAEHGRGLSIIDLCTDYYCFNDAGNELKMSKKII